MRRESVKPGHEPSCRWTWWQHPAQGDGDLPSAGTHSASYWRRGSEPARSGVGAIRGFGPSRPEKASCYAPHRLSTWRKRGAGWQRRVECSLTDPCQRKEPAPGLNRGLVCVCGWKRNRPRSGGRLAVYAPVWQGQAYLRAICTPRQRHNRSIDVLHQFVDRLVQTRYSMDCTRYPIAR